MATREPRVWAIYEDDDVVFELEQGSKKWEIERNDYDSDQEFEAAVETELAQLRFAGDRLGRGFTVMPIRAEVGEGSDRYVTMAWRFQDAFVPAAKSKPAEVPAPEREVVEAA